MASNDYSSILYVPPPEAEPPPSVSASTAPYAVTGTKLRVSIVAESWDTPGTLETLHCGSFEIDGISLDYGSGGSSASISAVSIPLTASIRREAKSRGWEGVTLKNIALDIAHNGGLSLMYESDHDPKFKRVDQRRQSDLAFLQQLCKKVGASVKVTDGSLIVFDEAKYEQREAIFTFKRGDKRLLSVSFTQDSSNTASGAEVSYKDPESGQLLSARFTPPNPPAVGAVLKNIERPMGEWVAEL